MSRKRLAPARWTLPLVVDPPDSICFQIDVPNDPFHIAAFLGSIFSLAKPYKWQNDDAHTAVQVGAVWFKIFEALRRGQCSSPQNTGADGDDFMLRQNPDNPCLIESSLDGTHWCTFIDISLCIPGPGQPGNGTPQPPAGGGQACYHAILNANSSWLLPTPISTGDQVQINNPQGSHSNSFDARWICPDGSQFFGGACLPYSTVEGSNPVPAAKTGVLVLNIAGSFYDLSSGSFTVPGGVSNVQATIQVNDATLAGLAGQLTFDACVTNNQAATWTEAQNLQLIDGGWSPSLDGFDGTESNYVPGTGWVQTTCVANNALTNRYDIVYIELPLSVVSTITHADITYDQTVGDLSDGGGDAIQAFYGGAWHDLVNQASVDGTNHHLIWNGSQAGVSKMRILLYGADLVGGPCPTPGTATLKQFTLGGTGTNPF